MKNISMTFYKKEGRNWRETYKTENWEDVYRSLARNLLYFKVFKSPVYKMLKQRNNYDGTRTIEIYQEFGKAVYIIEN